MTYHPLIPKGIVAIDIDGTLLSDDKQCSKENLDAIKEIKNNGYLILLATGRSLFSANKVIPRNFPADYIVFSTGLGVADWPEQKLLTSITLNSDLVPKIMGFFENHQVDYSLLHAPPNTHQFHYKKFGTGSEDFEKRLEFYKDHATEISSSTWNSSQAISQFLSFPNNEQKEQIYQNARNEFSDLYVIPTSSPFLTGRVWLEIMPKEASKKYGAKWLQRYLFKRHKFPLDVTLAIGNDHNDIPLLEYARHSFVMENSPPECRSLGQKVADNNQNGVAQAISLFLSQEDAKNG